jgi:ABC-type amino acid transport substrate-binding protein
MNRHFPASLKASVVILLLLNTLLPVSLQASEVISFNTYAPVAYVNKKTTQVDGPFAELVRVINQSLKQEIEFQFNPLPRMFVELEEQRSHAAFNMSYNPERAKKWHYSLPIHVVNYGVFVKKDNPLNYHSRSQLNNLTIATYGPTNMSKKVQAFAQNLTGTRVIVENSFEHVFKMLEANRFGNQGVVYVPDVVGFDTVKEFKLDNVRYAGPDIKNLYYIVFVKNTVSQDYVNAFNKELLKIHENGTMTNIYKRYKGAVTANVPSLNDMKLVHEQ